jgi:hypothetical protein
MTDTFIQLPDDGAGKKHRSWENTVGSDDVHATAGVITAPDGTVLSDTNGVEVNGNVASDSVDSGNPIKVGGKARNFADSDAVDNYGDRTDAAFDEFGSLGVVLRSNADGAAYGEASSPLAVTWGTEEVQVAPVGGVLVVGGSGGSLTVDNPVLSVVGGGLEATAQRVTLATDSSGVLSVDDNGGSLTVDGTVTANLAAGSNNIGDVDVASLPNAATATLSNVATSTASATLLASNAARKGAVIYNDSLVVMYVKFGTTASATSFTYYLAAGATLELPSSPGLYTGRIDGILASSTGTARVTELT